MLVVILRHLDLLLFTHFLDHRYCSILIHHLFLHLLGWLLLSDLLFVRLPRLPLIIVLTRLLTGSDFNDLPLLILDPDFLGLLILLLLGLLPWLLIITIILLFLAGCLAICHLHYLTPFVPNLLLLRLLLLLLLSCLAHWLVIV